MKVHRFEQYGKEWWKARCGIPTASCADEIVTPTGQLSKSSDAYINTLLADRAGYGDEPMEPTEWMQRGIDLEPEARRFFEFATDLQVDQVGFITNDDGTAGCSPDGLIGDAGWEVKCPKASTQFAYLRGKVLPPYYKPQVHFSMAVTGLNRWHFMSYFPGLEPLMVIVERDEYTERVGKALAQFIENLEAEAAKFGLALTDTEQR